MKDKIKYRRQGQGRRPHANMYMREANEIDKGLLREAVLDEHGEENIKDVYEGIGKFSEYDIINVNCLEFIKTILSGKSEKVNDFYDFSFYSFFRKRITKIMIKCILSLLLGIISFFIVIIITLIVDIFAVTVFDLLRKPLFICDYHILGYSIDSIFILIGAILGEFSFGGAIMHYLNKENTLLFIPVQIAGLFTFYYLIFFFSPKCDMTYITFELSQVHVVGYAIALSCFWLIRELKKMK